MSIKSNYLLLAFMAMVAVLVPCAMAEGGMTAAEVLALLPKGPDFDNNDIADHLKLVEQGESIYGALLNIVRSNTNSLIASRALGVLRETQGDKRVVVAELGKVLQEKQMLTDPPNERMLMLLAKTISDIGNENDKQLLQPLLSHPSEDVRAVARHFTDRLEKKAANLPMPFSEEPAATFPDVTHAEGTPALAVSPCAQTDSEMTAAEVWALLPKGIDSEDENQVMAHRRLVEQGESAYEALLAIVRECDDPYIVSSALAILRSSQGDKSGVVVQLKEYFVSRLQGETRADEIVLVDTASALADMGQEDDLESLIPMLSHSSSQVRGVGIMLLGERGGQKTLRALETAKDNAPAPLAKKGMEEAIAAIENRMAEKDAEEAPAP